MIPRLPGLPNRSVKKINSAQLGLLIIALLALALVTFFPPLTGQGWQGIYQGDNLLQRHLGEIYWSQLVLRWITIAFLASALFLWLGIPPSKSA